MSATVDDVLALIVATLRETADQVNREEELPRLAIDPDARGGYAHACHDVADAIERRSIAGGALRQLGDAQDAP